MAETAKFSTKGTGTLLLDELRVARNLEAAHDVGLESVRLPMPHDGTGGHAQDSTHLARAPVRGGLGRGLRGQLHQPGHVHLHRRRPARQVAFNPLQSRLQITLAPARDLHAPDAKLLGDVLVLQALGGQQHDARTLRQSDAGALGTREVADLGAFLGLDDRLQNRQRAAPPKRTARKINQPLQYWTIVLLLFGR